MATHPIAALVAMCVRKPASVAVEISFPVVSLPYHIAAIRFGIVQSECPMATW